MNENIDLTQILKDVPSGERFWHKAYGEVTYTGLTVGNYPVTFSYEVSPRVTNNWGVTKEGRGYTWCKGECLLVPSKDQQDWSKYIPPKADLPIDTPCMVSCADLKGGWLLRKYAGNGRCFNFGMSSVKNPETSSWAHIVPCYKFDFKTSAFYQKDDYGRK